MAEIRIKIRHEGPSINAYFPLSADGSEPPLLVASMATPLADMHPELFEAFRGFVTKIVQTMLQGIGETVERIEVEPAPEHERAGHG